MYENDYGNFEYETDFDRCYEMGHRPESYSQVQSGYGMSEDYSYQPEGFGMNAGYGRPEGFGMNTGYGGPEGFGPAHSPEARKEERLFSKLEAEGRFADIDKARHNEQYKNYLLENLDA